jgi:FkbM family methyltransferase
MRVLKRFRRSIRKRYVRAVHGDRFFVADYLSADFLVRTDNVIGREIAYRSFERDRLENFMQLAARCRPAVFIDVGANCGVYSCVLLKNRLVTGAVMIEPDRRNRELLLTNLMLNSLEQVATVLPYAAGARKERLTLVPGPQDNTGNSRLVDTAEAGELVDVVPIDAIASPRGEVIAVKIDVEGFEIEVLHGAERLLRNNTGIVQIESYDHADDVLDLMTGFGFALVNDFRPDFVFRK